MAETTVRLNVETKRELDSFREYRGESYDELIRKISFIAKQSSKNPSEAKDSMKSIESTREKVKTSGRYSEKDIKKILGVKE